MSQPRDATTGRMLTERTPAREAAVVAAFEQGYYTRDAAKKAGVDRSTVYDWMKADPAFRARVEAAKETFRDALRAKIAASSDWRGPAWILDEQERRREGALRRNKLRAEVRALEAKAKGLLPPDITVTVTDPDAVSAIFRQHFGDEGHRPAAQLDAPAHDPRAADGAHDVGEPALPVPAGVDR